MFWNCFRTLFSISTSFVWSHDGNGLNSSAVCHIYVITRNMEEREQYFSSVFVLIPMTFNNLWNLFTSYTLASTPTLTLLYLSNITFQWNLLVGWLELDFNVSFQHKYGYIREERSEMESYPLTQWRKASDILTSTLAAFLFSSHPKRERDREAHLNYYARAYNRGRQLLYSKTKLNQIKQNTNINLN